jgi:hypothetical protein
MRDYLSYFRTSHLHLNPITTELSTELKPTSSGKEVYKIDEIKFQKRLEKLRFARFEGIWSDGTSEIVVSKSNFGYIGTTMKTDLVNWNKYDVRFSFFDSSGVYIGHYFKEDFTKQKIDNVELLGKNTLIINGRVLFRVFPEYTDNEATLSYLESLYAQEPFIKSINENTLLLRIPSFGGWNSNEGNLITQKLEILLKKFHNQIISTPNLIIDICNNGGGTDYAWQVLLPYLYTNPIKTTGVNFLSTDLNNERMFRFSQDSSFNKSEREILTGYYQKLNSNVGQWVNLDSTNINVDTYDTIYKYPQRVGIIINGGNASAAEQFLLAAKQSQKVKLFGEATQGCLDFSNMNEVNSPCDNFTLGYAISKSLRLPEEPVDGLGIQPDILINSNVSLDNWVDFACKYYSKEAMSEGLIDGKSVISKVNSKSSNQPMDNVNISLSSGKNIGNTDNFGLCILTIKNFKDNDTICFYKLGYQILKIPCEKLWANPQVYLEESSFELNSIEINANKTKTKRLGSQRINGPVNTWWMAKDSTIYYQKFNYSGKDFKLRQLKIFIKEIGLYEKSSQKPDSIEIEFTFYTVNKNDLTPDIKLVKIGENNLSSIGVPFSKVIKKKIPITKGWHNLDFTDLGIQINDDFYLEIAPVSNASISSAAWGGVNFGGRLGGDGVIFLNKGDLNSVYKMNIISLGMYLEGDVSK